MQAHFVPYLWHWAISAVSIWTASHVFRGLQFRDFSSILVSALLLGLANAFIKPVLIILTLPLTLLTLGAFLLVINALMLVLVSRMVRGFVCEGFGTALLASMFIGIMTIVLENWLVRPEIGAVQQLPQSGLWL